MNNDPETLVLAGLMMGRTNPRLTANHFVNPYNIAILAIMRDLDSQGVTPGPLEVQSRVKPQTGAFEACQDALQHIGDPIDFRHFCTVLEEKRIERQKADILSQNLPVSETIAELVELAKDGLEAGGFRTFHEAARDYIDKLDRVRRGEETVNTIPTGFGQLDSMTRGLEEARLWVIAARPRIGKTSFLCALAGAISQKTTLSIPFYSLEMTEQQWTARMISMLARIDSNDLRRAELPKMELARLMSLFSAETGLLIRDTPAITPADIRQDLLKMTTPPAAVFVDYLQKMRSPRKAESRQIEVGDISRGLKDITKEFNIPLVVAAQINRTGADKPRIEHLRESGDIETEADVIALLHRQEAEPGAGEIQEIDLIVDKNRDGSEGVIPFAFDPRTTKFSEISE